MLGIVGVLELSTLLFNFRSAFYIKARQFRQKETEIRKKVEKQLKREKQQERKERKQQLKLKSPVKITRAHSFAHAEERKTSTDMLGLQEYILLQKLKGEAPRRDAQKLM
jgi:hypothetical protein